MSGYLLALASAVCNGSFAAAQKLPSVERTKPHPIIFNSFVCFGVVVSSLVVIPFLPLFGSEIKFNVLASLSGALFVGAILCSFLAIPHLGLAMAQGIWGGSALLVSFLWGVLGPKPVGAYPSSWAGSLGGIVFLTIGILGIVFHEQISFFLCGKPSDPAKYRELLVDNESRNNDETTESYLRKESLDLDSDSNHDTGTSSALNSQEISSKNRFLGIAYALSTGVFGGSVNVPSALTSIYGTELKGIETLPSFGLGGFTVGLLVPIIYFKIVDKKALDETGGVHFCALWLPGLASGTVWNIGNICSVYANSVISFAVAQPLMQCALLVSGMLGIFVFKEITGIKRIVTFFSFAFILLGGAVLLAIFGPG
jgi:hypothetical protein